MNDVVTHLNSLAAPPKEWSGTYTDEDKDKVRRIFAWLNAGAEHAPGYEHQRTQAKLGRAAHIKEQTIKAVLSGRYPSPPTRWLDLALAAIKTSNERDEIATGNPFVKTEFARLFYTVCRRARLGRDIGIVAAAPGVGKTFAMKQYAAEHPMTLIVEATEHMSRSVLLRKLVQSTRASVFTKGQTGGTQDQQFDAVVETLRGTEYLLIIDEADTMAPAALNTLRRISDLAQIGIVISGEPRLYKMVYDPAGRFSRIGSRFCMRPEPVLAITEADCRLIATAAHRVDGVALREDVLDAYWQICDGSARVLSKFILNVREFVLGKGYELTAETLYRAAADLMRIQVQRPTARARRAPATTQAANAGAAKAVLA